MGQRDVRADAGERREKRKESLLWDQLVLGEHAMNQ